MKKCYICNRYPGEYQIVYKDVHKKHPVATTIDVCFADKAYYQATSEQKLFLWFVLSFLFLIPIPIFLIKVVNRIKAIKNRKENYQTLEEELQNAKN